MVDIIQRQRRHKRLRKTVSGTPARPRLCIYRSLNHIYAQLIDDTSGKAIAAASTLNGEFKEYTGHRGNIAAASRVGQSIGKKAVEAGIKKVVFDRGGYLFHGRVKALAEAARGAGLEF